MKKILAMLLCLMMAFAVGCGEQGAESEQESAVPESSAAEEDAGSEPELEEGHARLNHNLLTGFYDEGAEDTRPVAVMINNLPQAYPQWGIGNAEVVVEALSEGKYPSMMCIFDNRSEIPAVGPVAPARDIMWQLAMPGRSILMQIGSNIYADNLLNLYQYQNLDGYYVGVTGYDFDRDRDAAGYGNEYCWYTKQELIANAMEQYGMDRHSTQAFSLFKFAEEAAVPENAQPANKLRIRFSEDALIRLTYSDGEYLKDKPGSEPHVDAATGEQLTFDNCVVLFSAAGVKDDGYTREYNMTEGTGLYLTQGVYLPVQWQKGHPDQPVRLFTMEGEPVLVNPGRTYLAVYGGFAGQDVYVKNDDTKLELPPLPGVSEEESAAEPEE